VPEILSGECGPEPSLMLLIKDFLPLVFFQFALNLLIHLPIEVLSSFLLLGLQLRSGLLLTFLGTAVRVAHITTNVGNQLVELLLTVMAHLAG